MHLISRVTAARAGRSRGAMAVAAAAAYRSAVPSPCFLTGASGFVGTNLAPLLARRHRLRCLVRPGGDLPGLAGSRRLVQADAQREQTHAVALTVEIARVAVRAGDAHDPLGRHHHW